MAAAHIDQLMERASSALGATNYFEAETLCLKALTRCAAANDFDRMARICLPLQEARRQKREEAVDSGRCMIIQSLPKRSDPIEPGCYLLEPPLIGIEAVTMRELCDRRKVPALVLCREPRTSAGKWPIVGVSGTDRESLVVRVQVEPPTEFDLPDNRQQQQPRQGPAPSWFVRTQEALGDAAIAKIKPDLPPDWRAMDLFEMLRAVPDHEKLIQALMAACELAAKSPLSEKPRRRAVFDDCSF
ncbi:MAG TPA: hypothetical protein VD997_12380 [Phycisphaerales bacterium]|nr:hypothetical protein [Phycisphaerales bacterium]